MLHEITQVKLNPFCRLQLDVAVECDLLLEETQAELADARFLLLLSKLRNPTSRAKAAILTEEVFAVDSAQAAAIVHDLLSHKILVGPERRPEEEPVALWEKRGWIEGLVFHRTSRNISYRDADGSDDSSESSYDFTTLQRDDDRAAPSAWKSYPAAKHVSLPPASEPKDLGSLEETLLGRRCNRAYKHGTLPINDLSAILHAANLGVLRARLNAEEALVTAPTKYLRHSSWSAIETYVSVHDVDTLEPGLYHYDLRDHALALVRPGDLREEIARFCLGQRNSSSGSCNVHLTGVWERFMYRYQHPRAYRTLMINVAELGQRYLLLATALGLNTFMTPQTLFRRTEKFLGEPHFEEALLYTIGMG